MNTDKTNIPLTKLACPTLPLSERKRVIIYGIGKLGRVIYFIEIFLLGINQYFRWSLFKLVYSYLRPIKNLKLTYYLRFY